MPVFVFQGSTCRGTRLPLSLLLHRPDLPCPPTHRQGAPSTLEWVRTPRVAPRALTDHTHLSMDTKVGACYNVIVRKHLNEQKILEYLFVLYYYRKQGSHIVFSQGEKL